MEQLNLNTQSSFTEGSDVPRIICPSPIRTPLTKVNFLIASQVIDMSNSVDDLDSNSSNGHVSPFLNRNLSWFRNEFDSMNDVNSDSSNNSNSPSECELSKSNSCRSSQMVDVMDDFFPEIIPRASNPIVKDVNFKKHNHHSNKVVFGSEITLRSN